jgi:hypothetical protein
MANTSNIAGLRRMSILEQYRDIGVLVFVHLAAIHAGVRSAATLGGGGAHRQQTVNVRDAIIQASHAP